MIQQKYDEEVLKKDELEEEITKLKISHKRELEEMQEEVTQA